jgi:tetratricopeptide (TPR) repeat protein
MPAVSTVSSYQLLASAREAFWLRDYQGAEDQYLQMIQNDPDNPDGYGELANMYFTQGNWEAAASAYYEAGTRLVKSGLLAPASELVDVIRGLNGMQADDLEQEIQMAREASQ